MFKATFLNLVFVTQLFSQVLTKAASISTNNPNPGRWPKLNITIDENPTSTENELENLYKILFQLKQITLSPITSSSAENCQCGKPQQKTPSRNPRFAHGKAATKPIPWLVSLEMIGTYLSCGGTLIDRRHILTAAHCFDRNTTIIDGKEILLARATTLAKLNELNIEDNNDGQINMNIDDIIIHPSFNATTAEYDIAIVRLTKDILLSDHIFPACLASDSRHNFAGEKAVIAGWGKPSKNYIGSIVPHVGVVNILDDSDCRSKFLEEFGSDHLRREMLCTESEDVEEGTATHGDSGGPVIVTRNGVKVVVGVISFAFKNLPNVHTRVSSFYHWITQNSLAGSCQ